MCGGLIMQVIETASERLAVQCDGPPAMPVDRLIKVTRVAAKGGLQIGRVEREKEVPQGVDSRSTPEASAEDGVQALTMHLYEGDDALIRGRTRQHG